MCIRDRDRAQPVFGIRESAAAADAAHRFHRAAFRPWEQPPPFDRGTPGRATLPRSRARPDGEAPGGEAAPGDVSYTHLQLPTLFTV